MTRMNRFSMLTLLVLVIGLNYAKSASDKMFMDKMCGSDAMVLDGNIKPGTVFQLSSGTKFQPNFSCTMKFRTMQPTQRLVVVVEQMNIANCPGDVLQIYDGTTLLNKDVKQQCGKPSLFTFTTTSTQVTFTFTTNSATKAASFEIALALHFTNVPLCPQNLGVFLCKNKNCIAKSLSCNKHNHCGDGTDELVCSGIGKK